MQLIKGGTFQQRKTADLLVVPCWQKKASIEWPRSVGEAKKEWEAPAKLKDFTGAQGECFFLYPHNGKEPRVALLGLGDPAKTRIEDIRRAYALLVQRCPSEVSTLNLVLEECKALSKEDVARGISEGILLADYAFDKWKNSKKEKKKVALKKGTLLTATAKEAKRAQEATKLCQGVYLARDLANGNADDINSLYFVRLARELQRQYAKVTTTILNKAQLEKEKMGLLLAVGRGARVDPAMVIMRYRGNPKAKEHTVLVGKGMTYDTGGLNLKPTGSMESMRGDMCGAAAVFGTIKAVAELGLPVNVTGVVPTTENSIDKESYKPGDIFVGHAGISVEIGNTDAEGRLILADALSYTCKKLKPSRIIDLATLTGAMVIALGEEATGMMCNDDKLAQALQVAGESTYERVWRLPLYDEYKPQLQSDFADLRNTGGRPAGSITAALFLQEFVDEGVPWAHLDIAGTGFLSKARRYNPKNGTGTGVRLLTEFLMRS